MQFERAQSRWVGVLVGATAVVVTTALIYLLKQVAPVLSTGVVYLLGVMLVSIYWGFRVGVVTALASGAAFNWFHIPPTGHFTIAESENWVALVVFLIVAAIASTVAQVARSRTQEAESRRQEADLTAEMARILLGGTSIEDSLALVGHRLSSTLNVGSVNIQLDDGGAVNNHSSLPLAVDARVGHLVLPQDIDQETINRIRERIVPSLEALLRAAIHRDELQTQVVETEALRRSDVVKTALLRAVSHDLRSPLTAIVASAEAVRSKDLDDATREELVTVIVDESSRLTTLIDKLLELSRIEAGAAAPRRDWCSVEELIRTAISEIGASETASFSLLFEDGLPFVMADAAQLERAFVNLLENSRRYSGGEPVVVTARRGVGVLAVRIIDRGPGISADHIDHIFEPFYRADSASEHSGSGLGLAIAKGFIEANEGTLSVESLPGQGTTFVIQLQVAGDNGQDAK